jgi:hypothetical protein
MILSRVKPIGEKGQTTIEYLLLLSMVFITSYIILAGPLTTFTNNLFANLLSVLKSVVTNGELKTGDVSINGGAGHPMDPQRYKALHL